MKVASHLEFSVMEAMYSYILNCNLLHFGFMSSAGEKLLNKALFECSLSLNEEMLIQNTLGSVAKSSDP